MGRYIRNYENIKKIVIYTTVNSKYMLSGAAARTGSLKLEKR